jgi:amino acid adenylation domain-containing protein
VTLRPPTLDALFREQVRQQPDAVALVDGELVLTYEELAGQAAGVATALAAAGVPPGTLVGMRLPRGAAAVSAILGILTHGCAYVPVDPGYPPERQRYIAADARLGWFVEAGDSPAAPPVVRPGPDAAEPHTIPPGTAYVIHTSGSTGDPKGVLVGHAHVLAMLDSCARLFDLGPDDVWSMFHSTSFDFSVWELWGALSSGGQVVVVPAATAADPRAFAALLATEQVTVLSQVPTAFGHLTAELTERPLRLPELRHLVFGGEAVDLGTLRRFRELGVAPRTRAVNMYGITEITVHATFHPLPGQPEPPARPGATPVGRPLAHLDIEVVDAELRPVASGEAGELLLAGDSVAFGYLGRPALTAERFPVVDGRRRYRSGDLGFRDASGALHCLGRRDRQVQVRGFRIEPGEIEHAMSSHPLVTESAVTVGHNGHGEPLVVGHYVCRREAPLDAQALRAHLAARLPAHLLPAALRSHPSLPVTPNGKTDLARLAGDAPSEEETP